jgi:hypothetical protein
MHFTNKFLIWWWFFFKIYFDATSTKKLFTFFIFFVWQMLCCHFKNPLRVHNLLRIHPKNLWWFPLKSMTRWIIKKLTMLLLNMILNFTFVCNLKKYNYDNPNCPPITFTLFSPIIVHYLIMYHYKKSQIL